MTNTKQERNYSPHTVIGMIVACVIACGWTIKIAFDNPVEMDTFYMEKYQHVDQNINEILELQAAFNAQFDLAYSSEKFVIGENNIVLTLSDKQGKAIENATVTLMLSRPETNQDNNKISVSKAQNGQYTFGPFEIKKPGRWQILSKIEIAAFKGYHKTEAYAIK